MMRTPSRLIPGFVAAVLVLSACGSDDDSTAGTVPATDPQGSTSAAPSDDGALVAPRPIQISGNAGGDAAAAEAAPASDRAASDSGFAPYQITHFEVGEGLPALPDNQIGYVFDIANAATINVDQIDALAAALGASGEATRHDDGYSAWWTVGPDDGTAPSLTVYEDAQLSWYYSPAWATTASAPSAGCAVAGSVGAAEPAVDPAPDVDTSATTAPAASNAPAVDEMPVCETIPPPEGILSADEAEARTRELMTAVGLDPAGYTFEPYADEWYASVSAAEQLEGGFAGRRFDAGFGANGELQGAGGQLASPAKAGPYELIDLDTAIARLSDQTGFWGGIGGGMAIDSVARSSGSGVATPDVATPDIAEAPVSDMPVSEAPPETVVPTEVTVTLVDVQADLWWVWDADGSVWLLPAYRFIGDDGGWYTVPAVGDEFLIQTPVPETIEPAEPAVDSLPVDTDPETGAPESIPDEAAPADTTLLEPYIGSSLDEFTARAEAVGYAVRVTQQDGVDLAVTADYSPQRVNVAVDGETVTKILDVG